MMLLAPFLAFLSKFSLFIYKLAFFALIINYILFYYSHYYFTFAST